MNKCRKISFYWIFFLLTIIGYLGVSISCIPYKLLDFQTLKPGHVKLGTNISKVEIHCEFCQDESQLLQMDSISRIEANTSLSFLNTLKENLEKSPIFQNSKFTFISSNDLLKEIKDYKTRIAENGIVIILDSIYLMDTILVEKVRGSGDIKYTYGVIHKFGCKTYLKKNLLVLDKYLLEDTTFWPPQYAFMEPQLELPPLVDAAWDTGIKAGERYAHYLAPYWVEQSRYFYYGNNKSFQTAFVLIQTNHLDSAIHVLQDEANKHSGKQQTAKALYNLAVVHELKNDFDNALILADSSMHIQKKILTEDYSDKIRLRKIDNIALDWQLND